MTLTSPTPRYDSLFLANYATINLKDQLARLPGVGNVNVFGAGQYSMRVWLDPNKLQARSLTTSDVINALKGQNRAGRRRPARHAALAGDAAVPVHAQHRRAASTRSRSSRASWSRPASDGQMTHLRDVARVELGAQTYSQVFTLNGKPAAGIGIYQTLEANALDVAGEVTASRWPKLAQDLPAGPDLQHPVQHHDLRQGLDRRGLQDAVRGRRSWC